MSSFQKTWHLKWAVVNAFPNLSISWGALINLVLTLVSKTYRKHWRAAECSSKMSIWAEGEAAMPGSHTDFSIVLTEALIKRDLEKDSSSCQEYNRQYREEGKFWQRVCVIGNHLGWRPMKCVCVRPLLKRPEIATCNYQVFSWIIWQAYGTCAEGFHRLLWSVCLWRVRNI